jgi:hypothetical protein
MLECSVETRRDWSWKPGAFGQGIESELPVETVAELDAAAGSFERTAALFRHIAGDVGHALGYPYPQYADDAGTFITKLCAAEPSEPNPAPSDQA